MPFQLQPYEAVTTENIVWVQLLLHAAEASQITCAPHLRLQALIVHHSCQVDVRLQDTQLTLVLHSTLKAYQSYTM